MTAAINTAAPKAVGTLSESLFPKGVLNKKESTTTKQALPIKKGDNRMAAISASLRANTERTMILNKTKAITRLNTGETIQLPHYSHQFTPINHTPTSHHKAISDHGANDGVGG